jgi:hypothetical protein
MPTPDEIGLFRGLTYAEYDALAGISQGRLWTLYEKTPAHFRWEMDHPEAVETPVMREGLAIHAAILEPTRFDSDFVGGGPINPKTQKPYGSDTQKYAVWETEQKAQGKTPLPSGKDYYAEVAASVHAHPFAGPLLAQLETEISFQWRNGETGLLLKGRADGLRLTRSLLLADLKSCRSAAPKQFGSDAYRNGYLFQLAMYAEGVQAVTERELGEVVIVAVEKEPPYGAAVYQLDEYQLGLGRDQMVDTLRQLAKCQEYGDWPCYPEGVEDLQIPTWAGNEWTPFVDGLEKVLIARAERAGRILPKQKAEEPESLGL